MLGSPLRLTAGAFDKLTAHKLSSTHLGIEVMLNVRELEGNASSGLETGSSKLEIFGICNPSVCRGGGCGLAAEQREKLDLLSIANAPFFPQRGIHWGLMISEICNYEQLKLTALVSGIQWKILS